MTKSEAWRDDRRGRMRAITGLVLCMILMLPVVCGALPSGIPGQGTFYLLLVERADSPITSADGENLIYYFRRNSDYYVFETINEVLDWLGQQRDIFSGSVSLWFLEGKNQILLNREDVWTEEVQTIEYFRPTWSVISED